jgi:uncharacterized membrane protein YoaK (UPF0700 family)
MTAALVVKLAVCAFIVSAAGFVALARWLTARECITWGLAWALAAAGTSYALATGLPASMAIARADLERAPAALLALVPWVAGAALFLRYVRPGNISMRHALALALLAGVPAGVVALAAGSVGGATRSLRDCQGNLKAIAAATREYLRTHKTWPPQDNWVNELFPILPHRSVFRCPDRPEKAYDYHRPAPGSSMGTIVFECRHPFLSQRIVVRMDLRPSVEGMSPSIGRPVQP